MAAQAPPPPPPADLVTSLQEQLGRVNAMLFNYVGALQRDAPPAAVKGEPLAAPPKAYDVQVGRGPGLSLDLPVCVCSERMLARATARPGAA